MSRSLLCPGGALTLIGLLLFPLTVSAHESVPAGDYEVEYGWLRPNLSRDDENRKQRPNLPQFLSDLVSV